MSTKKKIGIGVAILAAISGLGLGIALFNARKLDEVSELASYHDIMTADKIYRKEDLEK